MSSGVVLTIGFVKVGSWLIGVAFTFYRRRAALCLAFAISAYVSLIRAIDDAHHPNTATVDSASVLGAIAAGLIVTSFIAAQPRRGADRAARWTA
jgi:hypothetical protein